MTKIFAAVAPTIAAQASDRLLSAGGCPFDRRANKALVYVASDGVALISYTGSSFVEDLPTDEWLARELTGVEERFAPPPGSYGGAATWTATRIGPLPQWFSTTEAGSRLAEALDSAESLGAPDEQCVTLHMAGLIWDRADLQSPTSAYIAVVRPERGRYRALFTPCPRAGNDFEFGDWPPSPSHAAAEMEALSVALGSSFPDQAQWEDVLVGSIRAAARRSPGTIGRDCVTTSVRSSVLNQIRVRFHGADAHHEMVRRHSTDRPTMIPVAYTPWLIAQNFAAPPQGIMGFTEIGMGVVAAAPSQVVPFAAAIVDAPAAPTDERLVAATATVRRKKNTRKQKRRKR